MPLFDKDIPPPRRTLWDRILYVICAIVVWVAAAVCILG